jgi:DNA topoisomerase-3
MADIEQYVRELIGKIGGGTAPTAGGAPQPQSTSRGTDQARKAAPRKSKTPRPAREHAPLPLGSLRCPRCKQGHLITGARGWGCDRWQQGCGFVVWFETAGKRLSVAQLRALVTKGKTAKSMFVDGSGKRIEARLVLDARVAGGVCVVPV